MLEIAEQRAPHGFTHIHAVIGHAVFEPIAGFDRASVGRAASRTVAMGSST